MLIKAFPTHVTSDLFRCLAHLFPLQRQSEHFFFLNRSEHFHSRLGSKLCPLKAVPCQIETALSNSASALFHSASAQVLCAADQIQSTSSPLNVSPRKSIPFVSKARQNISVAQRFFTDSHPLEANPCRVKTNLCKSRSPILKATPISSASKHL